MTNRTVLFYFGFRFGLGTYYAFIKIRRVIYQIIELSYTAHVSLYYVYYMYCVKKYTHTHTYLHLYDLRYSCLRSSQSTYLYKGNIIFEPTCVVTFVFESALSARRHNIIALRLHILIGTHIPP